MRGVTIDVIKETISNIISTHTPHARRDPPQAEQETGHYIFQLTRLMRGVTVIFFWNGYGQYISTHTPHARRDRASDSGTAAHIDFNSHASCEA